jgi:hypothetical protein
MGQQQLLLTVLAVLIVGIAMVVGVTLFTAHGMEENRAAIISDLEDISANAAQYYIRPTSLAGGSGKFTGYAIPATMSSNDNGIYSIVTRTDNTLTLSGSSSNGTVTTTFYAATGKDSVFTFVGF